MEIPPRTAHTTIANIVCESFNEECVHYLVYNTCSPLKTQFSYFFIDYFSLIELFVFRPLQIQRANRLDPADEYKEFKVPYKKTITDYFNKKMAKHLMNIVITLYISRGTLKKKQY